MEKGIKNIIITISLLFLCNSAYCFEYVEHSYFTDRACQHSIEILESNYTSLKTDEKARYLALRLFCPFKSDKNYCESEKKQDRSIIAEMAKENEAHSITLGDIAALTDHISRFGPIKGMPAARSEGLSQNLFIWLLRKEGEERNFIDKVAEKVCIEGNKVDWEKAEKNINAELVSLKNRSTYRNLKSEDMLRSKRSLPPKGASDPSTSFTFVNPHFLDLVLSNANHFGESAYKSYLGFHTAAIEIAKRSCEENLEFSNEFYDKLREMEALKNKQELPQSCGLLREILSLKLTELFKVKASSIKAEILNDIKTEISANKKIFLDKTLSSLLGLLFEASGIHFLQDNISGGHIRTNPDSSQLLNTRHYHDFDNREGLKAMLPTKKKVVNFIAFGDSYLLAPKISEAQKGCKELKPLSKKEITSCLIRNQQGILIKSASASILDFVLGGSLYPDSKTDLAENLKLEVENFLPVGSAVQSNPDQNQFLLKLDLPAPPKKFTYESLLVSASIDGTANSRQMGLRLNLLEEFDLRANWLYTFSFGLLSSFGQEELESLSLELAYLFNYRWASRFLLNMGAFVYTGFNQFPEKQFYFIGAGPTLGLSLLPEGWTQIPLELGIFYRLPIKNFDSRYGFYGESFELEAHWIEIVFGLAFL